MSVTSLRRMTKGKLHVEFVRQELTLYSGLELFRRYLRLLDVPTQLRAACAATGGDYGGGRLALLILALFYVGARAISTVLPGPRFRPTRIGRSRTSGPRLSFISEPNSVIVRAHPSRG